MEFDGLIPIKEEPYYGYSEEISGFPDSTLDNEAVTFDEESELDDCGFKRFKVIPFFDDCSDVVGQSSWMKEELVWAEECEPSNLKIDGIRSLGADDSVTCDPVLPPEDIETEPDDELPDEVKELYVVNEEKMESRAKNDVVKKRYTCTLCVFECARLSTVKRHVLNHRKKMKFSCKICSFGCNMESRMDLHMTTRHKYTCDSRDLHSKKLTQLKQPLGYSHDTYSCDTCGKRFMGRANLEKHNKKCGEKTARSRQQYVCDQCGHRAESRGKLRLHHRSHHTDKPFPCDRCDYRARTAHLLKIHTRTHTKPYECIACKSRFSHPKLLQIHQQKCQCEKLELACDSCNYRTRFVAQLKVHLMLHSVGDYGCDICDKKFTSVRRLHDHKQSHSTDLEPLACKFCDYRCSMVDTLIAHSGTHKAEASQ